MVITRPPFDSRAALRRVFDITLGVVVALYVSPMYVVFRICTRTNYVAVSMEDWSMSCGE